MILKYGWGKHWGNDKFYTGYPYIAVEAANYMISKNVKLVAMDTPSPDDSKIAFKSDKDSQIHKIFLKNGVVLVEYLANLNQVNDLKGWCLIAMPLKIKDADGSPGRVCLFK